MSTVERTTVERVRELNDLFGRKSYFHSHADHDITSVDIEVEKPESVEGFAEITFSYARGKYNILMQRETGRASRRVTLDTDLERMRFRMLIAALMDRQYTPTEVYYSTHDNKPRGGI